MNPARKDARSPGRGSEQKKSLNHKQRRVLAAINDELERYGLAQLRSLGDYTDGEDEITAILDIHGFGRSAQNPRPYYYVVTFMVKRLEKSENEERSTEQPYAMIMNATHTRIPGVDGDIYATGAACVTTYNNEWMVLIHQYRATQGDWTVEIPRGFVPPGGIRFARLPDPRAFEPADMDLSNASTKDLPLGIVKDELGAFLRRREMMAEKLTLLAYPPENTGNSPNITPVFHLSISGDPAFVTDLKVWDEELGTRIVGPPRRRVVFAPLHSFERDCQRIGLNSHHCFASLFLYLRHARTRA